MGRAQSASRVTRVSQEVAADRVETVRQALAADQVQRVLPVCRVHAVSQARWVLVSATTRSDRRLAECLTDSCQRVTTPDETTSSADARLTTSLTPSLSDSTFKSNIF